MTVFSTFSVFSIVVNLASEPIIFILTSKFDSFKSLENNLNTFSWFSKHRLHWNTYSDMALLGKFLVFVSTFDKLGDQSIIIWLLTDGLLDRVLNFTAFLKEFFISHLLFLVQNTWLIWRGINNCSG